MQVSGECGLPIAKYKSISCLEAIAHTLSSTELYKSITSLYLLKMT